MKRCPHGYHYSPKSGMCNYHGDSKNYVSPKYDELDFPNFPPLNSTNALPSLPPVGQVVPPSTPTEGVLSNAGINAGELSAALDKLAAEQEKDSNVTSNPDFTGGASRYRKHSLSKRRSMRRSRSKKRSLKKKKSSKCKRSKRKSSGKKRRRSSRH
jgi:hypothetical protein